MAEIDVISIFIQDQNILKNLAFDSIRPNAYCLEALAPIQENVNTPDSFLDRG